MDLINEIADAINEIARSTIYIIITLMLLPVFIVIIISVFIPAYLIFSIQNEIKSNHNSDGPRQT